MNFIDIVIVVTIAAMIFQLYIVFKPSKEDTEEMPLKRAKPFGDGYAMMDASVIRIFNANIDNDGIIYDNSKYGVIMIKNTYGKKISISSDSNTNIPDGQEGINNFIAGIYSVRPDSTIRRIASRKYNTNACEECMLLVQYHTANAFDMDDHVNLSINNHDINTGFIECELNEFNKAKRYTIANAIYAVPATNTIKYPKETYAVELYCKKSFNVEIYVDTGFNIGSSIYLNHTEINCKGRYVKNVNLNNHKPVTIGINTNTNTTGMFVGITNLCPIDEMFMGHNLIIPPDVSNDDGTIRFAISRKISII